MNINGSKNIRGACICQNNGHRFSLEEGSREENNRRQTDETDVFLLFRIKHRDVYACVKWNIVWKPKTTSNFVCLAESAPSGADLTQISANVPLEK